MVEKIPNDVFQFSLQSAYELGLNKSGPLAAQLSGYGDHGLGRTSTSDLLLLDGRSYQIDKAGFASPAREIATLPFIMVTRFAPRFRLSLPVGTDMKALCGLLKSKEGRHGGGHNSMMPLLITGRLQKISFKTAYGIERLEETGGWMFGYSIPSWAEAISGKGIRMLYLSEDAKRGGPVVDFVVGEDVRIDWAVTGRFHLGLPSGPDFESLDLEKACK